MRKRLLKAEMFVKAEISAGAGKKRCGGIKAVPCSCEEEKRHICDAGRHTWPFIRARKLTVGQRNARGRLIVTEGLEAGAACRCGWRFVARTTSQPIV